MNAPELTDPKGAAGQYDVERIRADFPILARSVRGHPLVYLDNAATTQKPRAVIEAITRFYEHDCASVHRGVHALSEEATSLYEGARARVQRFLGAAAPEEIVFVRGATEGINLVAQSYATSTLRAGDEVLISGMEHHSNIVPWQMACERTGARLRVIPIDEAGELRQELLAEQLTPRTRLLAITHVSNALGTVNPIREIVRQAHARGVPVLVDGAQAGAHIELDMQELGCDFYVLSGHKVYGPTGIGVLYGRRALLEAMPPWQGGGDMIRTVTFERTTYHRVPFKFEAGTPNVEGAVGLAAALGYLEQVGVQRVAAHEQELLQYATRQLRDVKGVSIIGSAKHRSGLVSFTLEGVHPHDLGTLLDARGIAIRAGHHCAMPVMQRYGIAATARASFAMYNTSHEIDLLVLALHGAAEVFHAA